MQRILPSSVITEAYEAARGCCPETTAHQVDFTSDLWGVSPRPFLFCRFLTLYSHAKPF